MLSIKKYRVDTSFETAYIATRGNENRLLSAEEIKQLPYLNKKGLGQEWKKRIKSTERVIKYVKDNNIKNLLDLGSGNGWLTYKLAPITEHIDAIDVNLSELEQAAEVLNDFNNVSLIYGDIFDIELPKKYDLIFLNASIQYFPDFNPLMNHLLTLLSDIGSIHIVDSPFYIASEVHQAKQRSIQYYNKIGHPEMKNHYFHHSWEQIKKFDFQILYNPTSFFNRISRKLGFHDSPFPWIKIKNSNVKQIQ